MSQFQHRLCVITGYEHPSIDIYLCIKLAIACIANINNFAVKLAWILGARTLTF